MLFQVCPVFVPVLITLLSGSMAQVTESGTHLQATPDAAITNASMIEALYPSPGVLLQSASAVKLQPSFTVILEMATSDPVMAATHQHASSPILPTAVENSALAATASVGSQSALPTVVADENAVTAEGTVAPIPTSSSSEAPCSRLPSSPSLPQAPISPAVSTSDGIEATPASAQMTSRVEQALALSTSPPRDIDGNTTAPVYMPPTLGPFPVKATPAEAHPSTVEEGITTSQKSPVKTGSTSDVASVPRLLKPVEPGTNTLLFYTWVILLIIVILAVLSFRKKIIMLVKQKWKNSKKTYKPRRAKEEGKSLLENEYP